MRLIEVAYPGAWHSRHNRHSAQHRGTARKPAPSTPPPTEVEVEVDPMATHIENLLVMFTKSILYSRAKDARIYGRSRMSKAELAEALAGDAYGRGLRTPR